MNITAEKTIEKIQKEFNQLFPALRIVFYTTTHSDKAGTPGDDRLKGEVRIKEIYPDVAEKSVTVNGSLTVTKLEQQIQDTFKVGAQVFRKSGNIWLQTTTTDDLTLNEQNEKGLSSSFSEPKNREEIDYHEQK